MAFLDRFRGRKAGSVQERSGNDYYALYESQRPSDPVDDLPERTTARFAGGVPDYASWDSRLSQLDGAVATEERRRAPWWTGAQWRGRKKRWWAIRIFAAAWLAFFLLVGWLAYTAPLSKSLEPIAPPQITLLASDGTPIARSGAMVAEPVDLD